MEKKEYTIEEFVLKAKQYIKELQQYCVSTENSATILALHGDLGAGKTTFTQILARELGVEEYVVSPTFLILKTYKLSTPSTKWNKLVHIDAYRVEESERIETLGWKKITQSPSNLVVIEWPENIENIIPKNTHHIYFKYLNDTTRSIMYDDFR